MSETSSAETSASAPAYPVLTLLQKRIADRSPGAPYAELTGMRTVTAELGRVVMEMEANATMTNPMGTIHGGIFCGLADSAMAMAHASTLQAGETFTTLELKINFLRPVWSGKLKAEGKVVKGGRTIALLEAHVYGDDGQLVAHATSTCMTLRGQQAQGR